MEEQSVNNPKKILGIRGVIYDNPFESPLARHYREKDDLWKSVIRPEFRSGELQKLVRNFSLLKNNFEADELDSVVRKLNELGISDNEIKESNNPTKTQTKEEFISELNIQHLQKNLELVQLTINDLKNKKSERWIDFKRGAFVTTISVVLGCTLTGWITWLQKDTPINNIVVPKNAIKIYLQNPPVFSIDTSLVRLVKPK